ncbi:MAG: S-formylglutathione hydrolase [Oleispira sp.]|nr:S-formylglutathione hydrolase [Oleispira sp.]
MTSNSKLEQTHLEECSSQRVFAGEHKQFSHFSNSLNCNMRFAIFLPPQVTKGESVPVLYWLSGLTCTDENFMQKAGAFRKAAELGIAIVAPDTSPRGEGVADDVNGAYDLGLGAGFYLNATEKPWSDHYQMYDYVVKELPALIEANFPVSSKRAISGHSMGGHGALTISLRNPERYTSVSAFSPICHPIDCPWGQKAFAAYLGDDQKAWQSYDASLLMAQAVDKSKQLPTLVDQGSADNFLAEQLKPEALEAAAKISDYPLQLNMQEGYDHSYFFISSFIDQHLEFHAKYI